MILTINMAAFSALESHFSAMPTHSMSILDNPRASRTVNNESVVGLKRIPRPLIKIGVFDLQIGRDDTFRQHDATTRGSF